MIDEATAIGIATEFLRAEDIRTDGFADRRSVADKNIWGLLLL
jgi:hypothetical protein